MYHVARRVCMLHVIMTCQCGQNFEILCVQQLLKYIFPKVFVG